MCRRMAEHDLRKKIWRFTRYLHYDHRSLKRKDTERIALTFNLKSKVHNAGEIDNRCF